MIYLGGTYIGLTASPTNTLDRIFQFPSPHRDSGISSERSLHLSQGDESPFYNRDPSVHPAQRELPPPPPKIYSPPQKYAWNSNRNSQSPDKGEYARIKSGEKPVTAEGEEKPPQTTKNGGGGRKKPILRPKQ